MFFAVIPHLCGGGMDAPGGGCTCSPDSLISCRTTRENKKSLPVQRQPQKFFLKQKGNVLITQNALFSILTANVDNLPLKHFKSILGRNTQ